MIKHFFASITVLCLLCEIAVGQSEVRLAANEKAATYYIAEDYTGLSYEMSQVLPDDKGSYYFRADNQPLIAMFKTLGIRNLRVGGASADQSKFRFPVEKDIDSLFAFAKAAGTRVMFTMGLRDGDAAKTSQLAKYILGHYRPQLLCFAIGNDANAFSSDYGVYVDAFKKYVDAIRAVDMESRFCGPGASGGRTDWARDFAGEFNNRNYTSLITYHYFPGGDAAQTTDAAEARRKMLGAEWFGHYEQTAQGFVAAALRAGFNFRLEQSSGFAGGGVKGASDSQAAALWGLEYLHWWATYGCGGVNFPGGDDVVNDQGQSVRSYDAAFYSTPKGYDARPLAYAIKAFALVGHGQIVPIDFQANGDKLNFSAYGVMDREKNLFVTLINRENGENARSARVTLATTGSYARADQMALAAPKNDDAATIGLMLGGAAIRDDETWDGKWSALGAQVASGQSPLDVPPASAVVVRLTAH